MDRESKTILIALVAAIAAGGILVGFVLLGSRTEEPAVDLSTLERQYEEDVQDSVPTPADSQSGRGLVARIGTAGVSRGEFVGVDGNILYYQGEEAIITVPLKDEISLVCTNQDFDTAENLEYDKITKVLILSPSQLVERVSRGEKIIVFAERMDERYLGYTVGVKIASCPD